MSIAEKVIQKMEQMETEKQAAIEELLAKRTEIENQLLLLGYKKSGRGRPVGAKNKSTKKASK